MKPEVKIINGKLIVGIYPYLEGDVIDHPRFKKGDRVKTSRILKADFESNIIETKNTIYHVSWVYENKGSTSENYGAQVGI